MTDRCSIASRVLPPGVYLGTDLSVVTRLLITIPGDLLPNSSAPDPRVTLRVVHVVICCWRHRLPMTDRITLLHHAPFPFPLMNLCSFFPFWFLYCFPFHLCSLILTPSPHHHHLILCFSLYPLELNIHTNLTTWLSSCPVRIFFGFHHNC